MTANQHTEATRKKLREAAFFLRQLATVDRAKVNSLEPEAPDYYLSAFLSAARAVQEVLRKERNDEFNAWLDGWVSGRTEEQKKCFKFLTDQRNNVIHEGGPELTYTITPVSLMEFMLEDRNTYIGTGMPGTPQPTFSKIEKTFTAVPGQRLAAACQPLYDVMKDLVKDFERDHPGPVEV
jgi:hypothetical protein